MFGGQSTFRKEERGGVLPSSSLLHVQNARSFNFNEENNDKKVNEFEFLFADRLYYEFVIHTA